MKFITLTTLIILTFWASTSYGRGVDGNELKRICLSSISSDDYSFCQGFIDAAAGAASSQAYCEEVFIGQVVMIASYYRSCEKSFAINIPPGMEVEQAIDITMKYLNDHPEKLHEGGRYLVHQALSDAFGYKEIETK